MPVIRAESLRAFPAAGRVVRFLDARSGPDARERFLKERIEGSRHLHLEDDLAAVPTDARQGGRHPLPSPAAFARALGRQGVSPHEHLVVLDDRDGANAAARLYVMLRAIGHASVMLLSGGLRAARAAGLPTATGAPLAITGVTYQERPYEIPLVSIDDVEARLEGGSALLLDARASERFRGEVEPFDPVAGHVPGAKNAPYTDLFDEGGHLLDADALRARLSPLVGSRSPGELIAQCGSGVTACFLMVALEEAGLSTIGRGGTALWVGSYSEWSRRDKPIARGA